MPNGVLKIFKMRLRGSVFLATVAMILNTQALSALYANPATP
jgi:hypothetical protein